MAHTSDMVLLEHEKEVEIAPGERWDLPDLATVPFRYHRVVFESRTADDAYLVANSRDASGTWMKADHYTGIDASHDWLVNEAHFMGMAGAADMRITFHPKTDARLVVRKIVVDHATSAEVAAWADGLCGKMPPLKYQAPADRLSKLPRTVQRLHSSDAFRLLFCGDSVVNDAANSPFTALLERSYPETQVHLTKVPRTGEHKSYESLDVEQDILSRQPHLVVLGGISHGRDVDPSRRVIREVRAASDAEVLLLSPCPPVTNDPHDTDNPHPLANQTDEEFRGWLADMAREEGIEHIDITTPWLAYALAMPYPYTYLMRDMHHVNTRGTLLMATILARHFAPLLAV